MTQVTTVGLPFIPIPMRYSLRLACVALIATLASACTTAKISGRGTTPLLLNNPAERVQLVEHFKTSKRIVFDYTGAFDVSEVLSDVMQKKQGGDAVTNLTITIKSGVGDFFINLFTLGLANSKMFQVEGDLVKRSTGASGTDDSDVLAVALSGQPLIAKLSDFAGTAAGSPIVVQIDGGLALVRAH